MYALYLHRRLKMKSSKGKAWFRDRPPQFDPWYDTWDSGYVRYSWWVLPPIKASQATREKRQECEYLHFGIQAHHLDLPWIGRT
jgi:hypothetical protein